jgi:hypothetical protein
MSSTDTLSSILEDSSTIHFQPGTYDADFNGLDIAKNPQSSKDGFMWKLPNGKEFVFTFFSKVMYSALGDRTGPYFNQKEAKVTLSRFYPCPITDTSSQEHSLGESEMKKARMGFSTRLVTRDLPDDESTPEELFVHNEAVVDFFHTIQEFSDDKLGNGKRLLRSQITYEW